MNDDWLTGNTLLSNLDKCGFACSSCNFPLLLSNEHVGKRVIECFKAGGDDALITCPECHAEYRYRRSDLRLFSQNDRNPGLAKPREKSKSQTAE